MDNDTNPYEVEEVGSYLFQMDLHIRDYNKNN